MRHGMNFSVNMIQSVDKNKYLQQCKKLQTTIFANGVYDISDNQILIGTCFRLMVYPNYATE